MGCSRHSGVGAWLALSYALAAAPVQAGELVLELAPTLRKSSWRSDLGGGAQVRAGYRFKKVFGADAALWEEFHSVDSRQNTGLSLGLNAAVPLPGLRPTLRAYFVHQHEQGWVSLKHAPFSAVLGIGDGIRHRAGFGFSGAVEWPFFRAGAWELFFAPAVSLTLLPDASLGPVSYYGVAFAFGVNYSVEALP